MNPLITAAICGIAAVATAAALSVPEPSINGHPRVVDGDTLHFPAQGYVRLYGIDAPELHQHCGQWKCGIQAKYELEKFINGSTIQCTEKRKDKYNRIIGECLKGNEDIGRYMVLNGYAVDYTQYSGGYYRQAESEAKLKGNGLWSGPFDLPEKWRREHANR